MKSYPVLPRRKVRPNNPQFRWLEKDYPGYLHTIFMQGIHAGVFLSSQRYPFAFRVAYTLQSNVNNHPRLDFFWDSRDLARVRQLFINRSKKNLSFFNAFYKIWQRHHLANIKAYTQAERIDFSRLSDSQLYRAYHTLYWANISQGAEGYLADCFLSSGEVDWLVSFITRRVPVGTAVDRAIVTLTASTIPTYTNEAEVALARLLPRVKRYPSSRSLFVRRCRGSRAVWSALLRHARRYYWLENNYFIKVLTPEYFAERLYELSQKRDSSSVVQTMRTRAQHKKKLLHDIGDPWLARVITMTAQMTHMQDYRKMALIRWSHFAQLIFTEMARRTGLAVEHFHNVVEPEMCDVFMSNTFDMNIIAQRKRKNFVYGTPRGYRVYEGADLERFVDTSDFIPQVMKRRMITGTPASPGRVRGIVRIVKNAHQAGVFYTGDILVTNNTTPEYVPLMKKAGAIVTDQGGITTHAAIVSRELQVPCIIGTKVATKIFKDGDRVEVDAIKGIVKKI